MRKTKIKEVSALERAKTNRLRKYECPECHQIIRGTRLTSVICGRCHERLSRLIYLARVTPVPEELLTQPDSAIPIVEAVDSQLDLLDTSSSQLQNLRTRIDYLEIENDKLARRLRSLEGEPTS